MLYQLAEYVESCTCGYEGENEFEVSIYIIISFAIITPGLGNLAACVQVTDRFGHQIFLAEEDSSCCFRQCCESLRGFSMNLTDRQVSR